MKPPPSGGRGATRERETFTLGGARDDEGAEITSLARARVTLVNGLAFGIATSVLGSLSQDLLFSQLYCCCC